ncbi:MAG: hypothetical protein V3W34_20095 [Phycisphaerae bacterium]
MSAVTKVLTVLLAVLCIAFSMTAVSFTARTENWKALAEDYRSVAQIAGTEQRSLMAAHAAELASARDSIKNSLDRINRLERELQQATQQVAAQRGEIAQIAAEKGRSDALAQRLTNELGVAQKAREAVEEQRRQFETRNIELERRNIDLNGRVNELTTQITVLNQKVRQQEQQIHILREEGRVLARRAGAPGTVLDSAIMGDGGMGTIGAPRVAAVPKISGHVLFVDGDLVTLSVGSADRVEKGQVFVVFRGTQYIGDVQITDVEPNLSSGRFIRSAPGASPRKGDRAEDEYHFAAPP